MKWLMICHLMGLHYMKYLLKFCCLLVHFLVAIFRWTLVQIPKPTWMSLHWSYSLCIIFLGLRWEGGGSNSQQRLLKVTNPTDAPPGTKAVLSNSKGRVLIAIPIFHTGQQWWNWEMITSTQLLKFYATITVPIPSYWLTMMKAELTAGLLLLEFYATISLPEFSYWRL